MLIKLTTIFNTKFCFIIDDYGFQFYEEIEIKNEFKSEPTEQILESHTENHSKLSGKLIILKKNYLMFSIK